jgi:hypothetical protein
MKYEFKYAIVDRKIQLSARARKTGEETFGRPCGLNLARAVKAHGIKSSAVSQDKQATNK